MADKNGIDQRLLIWGLVAIIIAAVSTSLLTWALLRPTSRVAGEKKGELAGVGPMFSCGDFTVNLAESGRSRYVQAAVTLELANEQVLATLKEREPQLRDLIIGILRSKTDAELQGVAGMQALREEIHRCLNEKVAAGKIRQVYLTQLIIP